MDLQNIQTKLIHRVNALSQNEGDVQVDWDGGPSPVEASSASGGRRPRANFSAAVDTLQRRAEPVGGPNHLSTPDSAASVDGCIKQLNAIAYKINQISAEQEQAIIDMQAVHAHLAQVYPILNHQGQPIAPPSLNAQRAVTAAAEVDRWGNIVLAYRTVTPNPAAEAARPRSSGEANQLAHHIRSRYGASSPQIRGVWSSLARDVRARGQEPSHPIVQLGRTARGATL
ncbi:MAG: hypothetical protein WBG38_13530, partial [Nodosilinea sp.]